MNTTSLRLRAIYILHHPVTISPYRLTYCALTVYGALTAALTVAPTAALTVAPTAALTVAPTIAQVVLLLIDSASLSGSRGPFLVTTTAATYPGYII